MVWGFCKYYKVKPMSKDELPNLKETLKTGWKGLLIPVIILLPFILDYIFKDGFFTARLGEQGAKYLSSSILLFIGGSAFSCHFHATDCCTLTGSFSHDISHGTCQQLCSRFIDGLFKIILIF